MQIADNILKKRLTNVYFIWGRGKTTIANELNRRYRCFIYSTDEARDRHIKNSDPLFQPHMCRDYVKEYDVSDFWELPPEVISEREKHWLHEFTPMAILDLVELAPLHDCIICEGDIDYQMVIPVASHAVYLQNRGTKFDWFNRPDHSNALDSVKSRVDLSELQKDRIIQNARHAVGNDIATLPDWVVNHNIQYIAWDDNISIDMTTAEVARCFGFLLDKSQ